VNDAIAYYIALRNVGVSVEMHLYPHGGHAFGLRPDRYPVAEAWPHLVEAWLKWLHVLAY